MTMCNPFRQENEGSQCCIQCKRGCWHNTFDTTEVYGSKLAFGAENSESLLGSCLFMPRVTFKVE